jgi:hypothetical protein
VESKLIADNTTIPLIWTDEHQQIIDVMNLDTLGESKDLFNERIDALKKTTSTDSNNRDTKSKTIYLLWRV